MEIRSYICFHEASFRGLSSGNENLELTSSLTNTATNGLAVLKKIDDDKRRYSAAMNDAESKYRDQIARHISANSNLRGDQVKVMIDNMMENPEAKQKFIQQLNSTDSAKLARMENNISQLDTAMATVMAMNSVYGSLQHTYGILDKKISQGKITSSGKVETAQTILDRGYAIQQEGEEHYQDLVSELRTLSENLNEGFFGSIIAKIKKFFTRSKTEVEQLKAKALRL